MSERSEPAKIAGVNKKLREHIDQQNETNDRIKQQFEKLESLVGSQTDIAIHQAEQSKKTAERMDRIEVMLYDIKASLKAIQPRSQ
ncbi:BgTH12-00951 [Blumeria graminis f. sp. triticale]|uniref:BgTH12-00951 n=1 Tax=Blumeria graminis f. sp. triticale TaxID=1689686 RepID=A0A9W4GJ15_BLUGR|nr:BgTH12-00951 [Blumeria graminis f. sp. triticale]